MSDAPGARVQPPLIYAAGLGAGLALDALLPSAELAPALRWGVGGALFAAGIALTVWFLATFRRARTPVDLNKPSTRVVTHGPYRLSRNPGYLSLTLSYLGVTLMTSAVWALLPLAAVLLVMNNGVIAREERYLARRFGAEYEAFRSHRRRWV